MCSVRLAFSNTTHIPIKLDKNTMNELSAYWVERSKEYANIPEKAPEVDILLGFISDLQPKRVLEVGCNYGRELKYLEGLARLYGVDMIPEMIEHAKGYVRGTFKVGDAHNIPFNTNFVDLVYTDGLLSHLPPEKMKASISELVRVSKKHLLIIEYLGTRMGRNTIQNCKKFTWVHDYERMVAPFNLIIKYNQERFLGADLYKILLLEKNVPKLETIIREKEKKRLFELKVGKWKIGFGK